MTESPTTKPKWQTSTTGNDEDGFDWRIEWRNGSYEHGHATNYEEACKTIGDLLRAGEKPL